MNVATQFDGERIANDVLAQASALEVLRKRPRLFSIWNYWLSLLVGSVWGAIIVLYTGPHAQIILGAASGIALLLAAAAFKECLNLRRRLDAAIFLLLKQEG